MDTINVLRQSFVGKQLLFMSARSEHLLQMQEQGTPRDGTSKYPQFVIGKDVLENFPFILQ